jgi:adenylate cyclase
VTTLVERLDLPSALLRARSRRDTETETVQFAQAALAAAKQEGLQLAVRARYVALAVIACLLPIINPAWEQLYYLALLGLFALIGWAQARVGRVGVSRPELALLFCDLALLTFVVVGPNYPANLELSLSYHRNRNFDEPVESKFRISLSRKRSFPEES